ncbi:kinesin-like protein KIN-7K, chloroplastic isoform X3 [Cajanus cajan]|uniref:kinesin-like protein KIN-7K, chloroplastic isoform X3 n=1 Tax=Cajanus cajan TaxID=3821 RepID=UPI00098DB1AE|nr:kinesin-like protein KIN-7K, chloroplastic isoform X3 [Cajanus cajan]
MAPKRSANAKSKSKGVVFSGSRAANSPSSSTTSSSKLFLETSVDGLSSPASSSARSKTPYSFSESVPLDAKENVTVTVRFRPLNPREIRQGEEIAWYADGETLVRSEYNPSLAYAYDRVFGPTTTTRQVYDVAAQHIISGAMEGINGTIFAYGVTSSGKTHTMHVLMIIKPYLNHKKKFLMVLIHAILHGGCNTEFLDGDQRSPGIIPLAVKDAFSIIQETLNREFLLRVSYLEIYNEVVNDLLNPAGQNLRIREDAQGTFVEGIKEEVVLSPAHALSLIAAGEEHRHVGSTSFNLLSSRSHTIFSLTIESSPCGENSEGEAVTLSQLNLIDLAGSESSRAETTGMRRREGSYINKSLLTLGTVISKLTEGRASHVPYRDSKLTRILQSSLSGQGRISLICTVTPSSSTAEETHNTLKFAHRAKLIEIQAAQNTIIDEKSLIKKYQHEIQCLKEELEQMKQGIVSVPQKETGEIDFVLLKQKLEDGQVKLQSRLEEEEEAKAALLGRIQRLTKLILVSTKASHSTRFSNRPGPRRRHSFGEEELAYLPYKRRDLISDDENTDMHVNLEGNAETADDSFKEEKKTKKHGLLNWLKIRKRETGLSAFSGTSDKSCGAKSVSPPSTPQAESSNCAESRRSHSLPAQSSPSAAREDKEDSLLGPETPLISVKSVDEIDLLREQQKILSEEVALHSSALKRLLQEAARNPRDQIHTLTELMTQLNEKSFELEVKTADNHIIQEQLNQKIHECQSLQETIGSLKQQLADDALEFGNMRHVFNHSQHFSVTKDYNGEPHLEGEGGMITNTNEKILLQEQASEIEGLKQKLAELSESKEQLELRNQKLAEESSYAKGLASAAAVELKALSEQVAKLMNQKDRLLAELAASKNSPTQRRTSGTVRTGRRESQVRRNDQGASNSDIKRELALSKERELQYEAALLDRDRNEADLQKKIEESKQREAYLENELANMWVLVAKLKKSQGNEIDVQHLI